MAGKLHYKAMITTMNYCIMTIKRGLFLKPTRTYDGKYDIFESVIKGKFYSDYARNLENQRSISGKKSIFRKMSKYVKE